MIIFNLNIVFFLLQLKESTVVEWFKIFKEVCAYVIINFTKPVGGEGCFVEVNEYRLLSKEESHDVWLLNGVDRETGQNFIIHVEDLDCEALWPILKNYILSGTTVVTSKAAEYRALEQSAGSESLTFVLPNKCLRQDHHYHLDQLFETMEYYIERELHPGQIEHKELYAYKFLYFNRDGFCNVPASEVFLAFTRDVKLAYPGFKKEK